MAWEKLATRDISIHPYTEGFYAIAQASSFGELREIMPNLVIPKGGRVRFVMELKAPVASAFDLAGAELIFRQVMPDGLTLIDVYGEGASTVVVEAESDPAWLVAIGAFLAAHWQGLALATIGIVTVLGLLILSIAVLVTVAKAPEVIPQTAKWIAIGAGVITLFGIVVLLSKRKGAT